MCADRLAHRHYQAVRADYFEHILQLPLSYRTGTHSGRLMKVMITGTNTLWGMWLSFFREHFTSFVSLFILMPMTLFINWRYGLMLMALCAIFALLIVFVLRKTETLQSTVETYYTDQAERTKIYEEAQVVFKREAPWLTIAHSKVIMPMNKRVQGYVMSPLGNHRFVNVDVAE